MRPEGVEKGKAVLVLTGSQMRKFSECLCYKRWTVAKTSNQIGPVVVFARISFTYKFCNAAQGQGGGKTRFFLSARRKTADRMQ